MITRLLQLTLENRLKEVPAVVLLGPRQVGKTTLARMIQTDRERVYLDLESREDLAKLADPEIYLSDQLNKLVVIDEVHRLPDLFPSIRVLVDRARRTGDAKGLYLLLGSASPEILKQSGETLAGRVSYLELHPLNKLETHASDDLLWLRGGFPESFLADTDEQSYRWRLDFVRTYLERDIPQFSPRIATQVLRQFWIMLAHHQSGLLNSAVFARSLGVDVKTVGSYFDLLSNLMLIRRLQPWQSNVGKRIVKSQKVFIRDTGILHALLSIADKNALLSHPIVGASWEGYVLEQITSILSDHVQYYFYRTSGGAEIDILLQWPNGTSWAIEVKRNLDPKPRRGFHEACDDISPERKFVVYPGDESYRIKEDISVTSLRDLCEHINIFAAH